MNKGTEALIARIKRQTESFDTVVLKEDEANALIAVLEQAQMRIANPDKWTRDLEETLIAATDRNTEMEARLAELEISCDRNYIDGMNAGWGYCETGNKERFDDSISLRSYLIRAAGARVEGE
ncbi:hypothetical protein MUA02_04455 [Enterobacteriaceae bacterium H20N1]|uniref:Ead/Ea22-like family protein n=1 Tax=Dryocola boscaweniae TaxID=2925397 RepID=A0A9X3ABV7_9ENTR|nr:hypothetical protein [Dryocola boscaweniae]MCT4701193.1 hypothetical protein [Dryocola boscaweniae]MCT4718302.1 hypothetical protein [Dryocola boscaweniae]